jgi:hypothetical protein
MDILTPAHFLFDIEEWDESGGNRGLKIYTPSPIVMDM